jgi:hypothetical protein
LIVLGTKPNLKKALVGLGATLVAGAAGFGLTAGTAQAEPGFVPTYHWCPGQYYDPGWGPNWDQGVCHDDSHRDRDGNFHDNDYRGGPPQGNYYGQPGDYPGNYGPPQWAPPPDYPPGNYYMPPDYNGPPPPPGGWLPSPWCIPFVNCAPT